MKKSLVFLLVVLLWPKFVLAEENHFYLDEAISGVYTMMDKVYHQAANYVFPVRKVETGEYVYCVTPGIAINPDGNYEKVSDSPWSNLNISKDKYEKMQIISYYGYQYPGHEDLTWYAVTQYLIWQEVLPEGWSVYFTDTLRGSKTNKYDWMINELQSLVNAYYLNPNIPANIIGNYKEPIQIVDNNNVLSNYISDNTNVILNNNILTIKPNNDNFSFNLEYQTNNISSSLYTYNEAQWVISRGTLPEKSLFFNVKIPKGNLIINKEKDLTSNSDIKLPNIPLKGAIYAVYNENYYKEYETDDKGDILINGLNIDHYYIKEIKAPYGFIKDDNIYEIDIVDESTFELKVFDKYQITELNITKNYINKDTYHIEKEDNICFGITDLDNNILTTKYTDVNGKLSFYLPVGNYILKQLSTKKDYGPIDDQYLSINEDKEVNKEFINYPIIYEKPILTLDSRIKNPMTYDGVKCHLLIFSISIIIMSSIFIKKMIKKRGNND